MKYYFDYNKDDADWPVKHCLNKMLNSFSFPHKVKDLVTGECGGEIDWHILKWSKDVGSDFQVEKYDGFMAYLGHEEHGLSDGEIFCIIPKSKLVSYLKEACDFYGKYQDTTPSDIESLKESIREIGSKA
ncbi:hypothetical protein EUZ85_08210 [Hahella sp. KA22]|uniref:hypothetical protein n=1 Tax=Hahella sp. KA22 TaxID=1628392 RepID=UPI000FDF2868|nr:hypothetical protein [Hahella sp. KA22]AZZ90696.1 hypothetical protein ENC22_05660 [Hahella sp. KA22]QAY54066.1 hypothetical protein EUZ85_08210 [Hahella sp. KA22]